MNANKLVDLDQIADQLASDDASPDSTLKELKAELDTLAVEVATPVPADEFGSESALERGLDFVKAIGHELSAVTTKEVVANPSPAEDLGMIREYQLLAKLGEGGMGAVYKALHTKLGKVVALKILPADRLRDEAAVARFEREMKAVGKLEHPNIVAARDAGEADGTHYLVMELVNGIDLSNLVRKVGPAAPFATGLPTPAKPTTEGLPEAPPASGGPAVEPAARSGDLATTHIPIAHGAMTIADACEMVRQAAVGLQEAHEDGMVHRDIKPSNLMLARSRKGRKPPLVKILDMGLALLDNQRGEQRDLTSTGQMMGTLDYMAPEQGLDSHEVDIRADIYSLGATLHKLLTGQAPFPSDRYNTPVKLMMALATQQVPSIATLRDDLPVELVVIVDRMLARNPDERFAEPKEVAQALKAYCDGCDLALLLENSTAEDAESAEEDSAVATHESLKSNSVETAPTIEVQSTPHAPREESGVAGVEQREPPAASPSPAMSAAFGEGLPTSPKPRTEGLPVASGRPTVGPVARSGDLATTRAPSPRHPLSRSPRLLLTAAALAGVILLSAIIFYIKTNHGTIVVEIDDPSISVTVQGEDIQITKNDSGEAYKIKPGEHTLHVKHGELEFDTDKFTLRRGEKVVLSVRLAEGEVQVLRKDEKQTVIGSRQLQKDDFALAFDGESNYVEISSLKYDATHPITVEAWVVMQENGNRVVIHFDGSDFLSLCSFQSYWHFLVFNGKNVENVIQESRAVERRRVHIAGTWVPESAPMLFVDGTLASVRNEGTSIPGLKSGMFRIGASNDFNNGEKNLRRYFHGTIDEVRISNVARYDKDFTPAERFEPDEHTLALYHFDEGQGEIAHDSSPNKHHGKIVGAKWVPVAPDGPAGTDRSTKTSDTPNQLADDPDLHAAKWVVSVGGFLCAYGNLTIDSRDDFPNGRLTIEAIYLNSAKGVTDEGLRNLAGLKPTILLNLGGCRDVTDLGLTYLNGCRPYSINIGDTNVTDEGLATVAAWNPVGVTLSSNHRITDRSLSHLAKCGNLKNLIINDTMVSDAGVRNLYALKNLHTIWIQDTKVTADGLAALKVALPKCKITSDFTDEQIAAAMAKISPDRHAAIWVLSEGGNVVLTRDAGESITVADPKDLPKQEFKLLEINLQGNERVDDTALEQLKSLANLRKLSLSKTKVTVAAVTVLQKALPGCQIESDFTNEEIAAAIEKLRTEEKK